MKNIIWCRQQIKNWNTEKEIDVKEGTIYNTMMKESEAQRKWQVELIFTLTQMLSFYCAKIYEINLVIWRFGRYLLRLSPMGFNLGQPDKLCYFLFIIV